MEGPNPPVRLLRRALPYIAVVLLAVAVYDGWIFYSRWNDRRRAEQAHKDEETRRARQTIDMMGGTDFRIMHFYAYPDQIRHGEKAKICFGVYGAKQVRIDPPVETLKPVMNDCIQVAPEKTTDYKLTAEDGAGHTANAVLVLHVR